MNSYTRREAFGVAALAGAATFTGLTSEKTTAAEQPNSEFDETSERGRVVACGFTEAEAECWVQVAKAAGTFFELPKLHPMDDHEVSHAIHVIQQKLLGRPAYRRYKELATGEQE